MSIIRSHCWAVVMVAAAIGIVGCSGSSHVDAARLDVYHGSDISFFKPVGFGESALEAEHYDTVREATQHASAVIIAAVIDVRPGSTTDETPDDMVRRIAIDIHAVEVIKGELEDNTPSTVTLELVAGSSVDESIAYMKAHLPEGLSVWFLRHRSAYSEQMKGKSLETTPERAFRLISSQGLFVQGRNAVTNPLVATDHGMADQAEDAYPTMSHLVDDIRSVEGWTGRAPKRQAEQSGDRNPGSPAIPARLCASEHDVCEVAAVSDRVGSAQLLDQATAMLGRPERVMVDPARPLRVSDLDG
jgi:hypothetical protein